MRRRIESLALALGTGIAFQNRYFQVRQNEVVDFVIELVECSVDAEHLDYLMVAD